MSNNRDKQMTRKSCNIFNIVEITDWKDRISTYSCNSLDAYNAELAKTPDMCELIGRSGQQIKPVLDVDAYVNDINISKVKKDLQKVFPNKKINYAKREPREYKDKGIKYSYRFYVKGVRMTSRNIKTLLIKHGFDKNPIYDMSIYDKNKVLLLPFTTKKMDGSKVPPLIPIDCDVFDCCASYIEEEYEDLDWKVEGIEQPKKEEFKKEEFVANLCDDDNETVYDGTLNFGEIVVKLSKARATDYHSWFYVGVSLINLFYRKIVTKAQVYDLFDIFSAKADSYNADEVIKVLDINFPRFNGKGYGIKYLLDCLKIDNPEYYKTITKKDFIIDGSNDDIGASKIFIELNKDLLVICKGILYVKNNDVWVCNQVQVDKILIDMIGKTDILFFGADGKRKYHYNKSIKHIKDCITCIKANQTIINDKFYDEMIKNNKFYLPFNDGIYSFKDKKLFKYEELPNIHFTFKINRNFPKYNKKDYDDLIKRVIAPIYPNEDEQIYNAHIKARALAGCYEDKVWYGYSGARNSGKGTETGLMKGSFGEFVLDFNAKCLISTKNGNTEPAKALGWVVEKKDARIIISNEIECDDKTILNGAFIKTLASGGDSMEGRRLYENTVSFVPQFTMFLCYNQFCEISPADAKENLEQFEYKSKFVDADKLNTNNSYYKLKDETIKDFIKEERIVDAYTLYILNAFTNPRMATPESVKVSTNINNGEEKESVETFIINNFVTTKDNKDRMHTQEIAEILMDNEFKITIVETGRLLNRMQIGKYNAKCNVKDKGIKGGFDFIKFIPKD